jgi:glycine cleavage system H lipoate-binding protein
VRPTRLVEWFTLASDAAYHPGHAWARREASAVARLGLDDFAQRLVGPISRLDLPAVGTNLRQGEPAWTIHVDGKAVEMLSPVDGRVSGVNAAALANPAIVNADPYGDGWLLRVEAPRLAANTRSLLQGRMAIRWFEEVTNALRQHVAPQLGLAMQDGGMPVDGLARAIRGDAWDTLAREFLLTAEPPAPQD